MAKKIVLTCVRISMFKFDHIGHNIFLLNLLNVMIISILRMTLFFVNKSKTYRYMLSSMEVQYLLKKSAVMVGFLTQFRKIMFSASTFFHSQEIFQSIHSKASKREQASTGSIFAIKVVILSSNRRLNPFVIFQA